MGWETASLRQAKFASDTRLSADLDSPVSAKRVTSRCTRMSSCKNISNTDNNLKKEQFHKNSKFSHALLRVPLLTDNINTQIPFTTSVSGLHLLKQAT